MLPEPISLPPVAPAGGAGGAGGAGWGGGDDGMEMGGAGADGGGARVPPPLPPVLTGHASSLLPY